MRQNQSRRAAHDFQFNVAQLLKETTGATRYYDLKAEAVSELGEAVTIIAPLTGQIKLLRTGSNILVTGVLTTRLQKVCGRCLSDFAVAVTLELEEEFYPTLDILTGTVLPVSSEADEATRIDEQHILDLWEVVRQDLLLASDEFLYCRPDCKGLCPHCGQDRNLEECNCQDEVIDPRWANLQTFHLEE